MNRRTALFAGLAALALAPLAAAPFAAAQSAAPVADLRPRTAASAIAGLQTLEGAERDAAIAAANRALNGVSAMQGRFVQVSPDGARAEGAFYMQRPGKLRFEYDPPSSLLIVSDGSVVALRDSALRTTDRTPLRSTPLNLVLRSQVDLARDARIVRVSRQGEWTLVTARDRSGQTDGAITMHFFGDSNELRSWDVVDMTGARTRIALSDITRPASLDRALFRLEDMLDSRRRGRP
jgi:outer membrane lipoprotein-sorting protein